MNPSDNLIERIRAEYREMPGLRLTIPQACRMWQLDHDTCEAVMKKLTQDDVVRRMADGAYVSVGSSQLKAALGGPKFRRTA